MRSSRAPGIVEAMPRTRVSPSRIAAVGAFAVVFSSLLVQAAGSALAPPAKAPALGSLRYYGLGADRVGRESVVTPNGERDAHFRVALTVRSKVVLGDIVLQRVFAKGGYAEGWDTNPGTSASLLGVYLNGTRLNPTNRNVSRTLVPGRYRLDVYANELGIFAPGQLFKLTAQFSGPVTVATRPLRLPGGVPTLTARFAGVSGDFTGAGTDQKPNGQHDAHFVVDLDTHGSWQIIENVSVRRLTASGEADLPIYWMQGPQTAGLFVNGKRVTWPTAMPWWIFVYVPLNPAAGTVRLDVYANDPTPTGQASELFGPGQKYRVAVAFTDSGLMQPTSAVVTIG